jgi:Rrf2 family protein
MFSKATEYALRATIYIAQKSSEENKLGIDEIAEAINTPKAFTAKILQILCKDNTLVSSVRGPNGGYYISNKAKKLPVFSIVLKMGEKDVIDNCVLGLKKCSEKDPCPMHHQYKKIKADLINLFESKSIEQLAKEIEKGKAVISG